MRTSNKNSVVVIGGGLAGLSTAWSLRQVLGEQVHITVLESGPKLGGRACSLPVGHKAGCEQPFAHHGPLLRMAEALGLEVKSYCGSSMELGYCIGPEHRWVRAEQWSDWADKRYPTPLTRLSPYRVDFPITTRYAAPSGWLEDPVSAALEAGLELSTLANMSVAELLQSEGLPATLLPFVSSLFHVFEEPDRISALSALMRSWSIHPDGRVYTIEGSFDRLTAQLADVPDEVYLNCPVVSVEQEDTTAHRITIQDGRQFTADHVVFALSAAAMRELKTTPELPPQQRQALAACRTSPMVRVFARVKDTSWIDDGLPQVMLSDSGFNACFPVYDVHNSSSSASKPELWGVEIVFIGDRARALIAQTKAGASLEQQALACLVERRPSMRGCLEVKHAAVSSESTETCGAIPYFEPSSEVPAFHAALQVADRQRYLAGDHTEACFSGWDGAVLSGMRAARQIAATQAFPTLAFPRGTQAWGETVGEPVAPGVGSRSSQGLWLAA